MEFPQPSQLLCSRASHLHTHKKYYCNFLLKISPFVASHPLKIGVKDCSVILCSSFLHT